MITWCNIEVDEDILLEKDMINRLYYYLSHAHMRILNSMLCWCYKLGILKIELDRICVISYPTQFSNGTQF